MQNFIKSLSVLFAAIFAVMGFASTPYDEPIDKINGGDPCIYEDASGCYYTFTTGGGIDIFEIESFDTINVKRQKTIFWSGWDGTDGDIWAPEIHKFGDRWYIVASAKFRKDAVPRGVMPEGRADEDHGDYYRYTFVLESKTEDIFGDYEFKGIIAPNGLNNIDGTYLQKDGKLYYVTSAYMAVGHQCLYICEMENPYTLKTDEKGRNNAVKISSPKYLWETRGWKVNEGPAVLYHEDDIFIVYSASGYSSNKYGMGMLTLKGDDVMNAKNWKKSASSVSYHQPMRKIYSAGHCSFLYREGGDIYMTYHANSTRKFSDSPRLTYQRKVEFVFGKPLLW